MQFINEQSAATLERFIERLEFRGTDPVFAAYRDEYLELIDLPHAAAVLDLGCGTGVVTRAIAARTRGIVTGVDQSPQFIAAAQRLAAAEGVGTASSSSSVTRTSSTSPPRASTPSWLTRSSATSATRSPCSSRPRGSPAPAARSPSSTATTPR